MNKRAIFVAALLPFVVGVTWAEGKVDTRNEPKPDVSYAFGMALGYDIKETGLVIDYDHFMEGLKAAVEEENMKLTLEEAIELIQITFLEMQQVKMAENLETGRAFLRKNAEEAGVQVTESGLQYTVIEEGDGEKPVAEDTVRVHYEGSLVDGTIFDSSRGRGEPAEFPLGAVIPGWAEGLQLMNVGSRYKLFVPSELGYGEWGAGDIIPPNSVLIFDVELLEIVRDESADDEAAGITDDEVANDDASQARR
jgi:FKBP-type peptidyl-prolyl cis-trans isomerase FkpA